MNTSGILERFLQYVKLMQKPYEEKKIIIILVFQVKNSIWKRFQRNFT